jgi:hypothetical protein
VFAAAGQRVVLIRLGLVLALGTLAAPVEALQEQEPTLESAAVVERVEVTGNRYVASETFLHYVSTKVGDLSIPCACAATSSGSGPRASSTISPCTRMTRPAYP